MDILRYNELDTSRVAEAFQRVVVRLRAGDFRSADVKKLSPGPYYRAKLSDADRLLFRFGRHQGRTCLLLLEVILNHAYEKSRFLNGASVDESKLRPLPTPEEAPATDAVELPYVSPARPHFHLLDKVLSFDDAQDEAFRLHPPLILIGGAGSGKTVLGLEKLKQLTGDILYVTHSAYLAENARNLYYAHDYENDAQNVEFLSYKEYLESVRLPPGRPMTYREFARWFGRHAASSRLKNAHQLFEEFTGVLTGFDLRRAVLPREDYLALGVRRSIFTPEERPAVYDLFVKYLEFLKSGEFFDLNLAAHAALPLCEPTYDHVVVDEVQDLTNVQLHGILRSLRSPDRFILCGDANQIVHPNFFSWANVKTMFHDQRSADRAEIVRVLCTNYRNAPEVTEVANRLLRIKNARFGSIDRESNYLVRAVAAAGGGVELLPDSEATRRELDAKTRQSTRVAVLCLRDEDKPAVAQSFRTPLLFSVQEAKGLEYETVILCNVVSGHARQYDAIAEDVTREDATSERAYARAKDKADKSLEAHKFYVNALYVAMSRAVRRLYIVEANPRHRLLDLLGLSADADGLRLAEQRSTTDEWKAEARKLELQGKTEQADAIRRTVLQQEPVPWPVWTPANLETLKTQALDPVQFNKPAKQTLFEYAVTYQEPGVHERLLHLGYHRSRDLQRGLEETDRKYQRFVLEQKPHELNRRMDRHGVDFRDPLNQTPLMLAAAVGRVDLARDLIAAGANPRLRDNWGRTPLQIALRRSLRGMRGHEKIGGLYDLLAPPSLNVNAHGRLVKLDRRQMEYFLLNAMLALLQDTLREKIRFRIPAFEARDLADAMDGLPHRVLPAYRQRRDYVSAVLARNEVSRVGPNNRKLFLRVHRGFYIPNPALDIEVAEDEWVNVYDLVHISVLEREKENPNLQALLGVIRRYQRWAADVRRAAAAAAPPDPDAAASSALPAPPPPAAEDAEPPAAERTAAESPNVLPPNPSQLDLPF
jgi:hypothetical protein